MRIAIGGSNRLREREMGGAGFDWLSYVKEGGAYCAPLLLAALYWMDKERRRLLKENKDQDTKVHALAERVITVTTEMKTFLFHERKRL